MHMPPPDDQPTAFIDCYKAEFPEDDPQSAVSYGQMLSPVFDFEVPSFSRETAFFARSDIYCLPDVTLSRVRSGASRFTRTAKTIAERGTDQILVVCYTTGGFTMMAAGQTRQVEAGELAFIDLSQEITIEATAVGITRSTLYRLFEPLGGVSAYITQRKMHRAFRVMVDTLQPRQRVSQMAFELGFSHPSAFTRAFKESFRLSPTDVQMLAAQSKEREIQLMVSPDLMKYLSPIVGAPVVA